MSNPCTLCSDGSPVTLPDYVIQIPGYTTLSCLSISAIIPSMLPNETVPECTLLRQLSSVCGCPVLISDACHLCADGSRVPKRHVKLEEFAGIFGGNVPTCELVEAYLHSFPSTDDICFASREASATKCGCTSNYDNQTITNNQRNASTSTNNLNKDDDRIHQSNVSDILGQGSSATIFPDEYDIIAHSKFYGAENDQDLSRLYTLSRSSSIISTISCLLVILDCLRWKKKRRNVYNQLVGTMTVFDLIYSIFIALGTIPMDTSDISVSQGEAGTAVTCKIQGGAIQWGTLTSLFLNCALTTYYLLVIVYNAKESRLRNIRRWLLGIPILCGSILGFSSIPFISNGTFGCHLTPRYPLLPIEVLQQLGYQDSNWPFIAFLIVPAFLAIFYSTFITSFILIKMWKVDKRSQKWNINQRTSMMNPKRKLKPQPTALTKLRREVFQQCFQYLAAVYLTWFLYLIVTVKTEVFVNSHYGLWLLVFFLGGFQGFLNCMIYFQPRLLRYWRHCRQMWEEQQQNKVKVGTSESFENHEENRIQASKAWSEIAQVEPAVDVIRALDDISESKISQNNRKDENHNHFCNHPIAERQYSCHEPQVSFREFDKIVPRDIEEEISAVNCNKKVGTVTPIPFC